MTPDKELVNAVIRVDEGRGFIVEAADRRFVITAGHCLPRFPPSHGASYLKERTYPDLLGRLVDEAPTIYAECLYADPIADIAVLGTPDEQALYEEAEAYDALMSNSPAFQIGEITAESDAWVLTLNCRWVQWAVKPPNDEYCMGVMAKTNEAEKTESGMSGSPILDENSSAIGIVCLEKGQNARLTHALPGWLLKRLGLA